MKAMLADAIRRLRPAPLAAAIVHISGMDRRKLVHTKHGTFFINPMSLLGSCLLRKEEYEPFTRSVLSQYLKPGGVFVDLGANEGYFTVLASRLVGPNGRVIAIEPQTRLQEVIQANVNANDCRNVRVIKVAICSHTQKIALELTSSMNTGATSMFRSTKYPLRTEEIQGLTLAALLETADIQHCDLMKIDIEGAEYDALFGSQGLLKRGAIRTITVEVHHSILKRRGLAWEPVHQLLETSGYELKAHEDALVYNSTLWKRS